MGSIFRHHWLWGYGLALKRMLAGVANRMQYEDIGQTLKSRHYTYIGRIKKDDRILSRNRAPQLIFCFAGTLYGIQIVLSAKSTCLSVKRLNLRILHAYSA